MDNEELLAKKLKVNKSDLKYLGADVAELLVEMFKILDHQKQILDGYKPEKHYKLKQSVSEPSIPKKLLG